MRAPGLGAQHVLCSERLRHSARGRVLPVRCLPTTGVDRISVPGPRELFTRKRQSACLHGVVAITADGSIRPCPMIPDEIGHMASGGLRTVFRNREHEKYWNLSKDRVSGCAQCEYRYGCVDCAAVDLCRDRLPAVGRAICGYDPSAGLWGNSRDRAPQTSPSRP
jgi:radical SAM protein with 4Fe4S-binding SPASM domain